MRPQEIIAKKRDGGRLSEQEIDVFIDGVCSGSWPDYQISALIMAMFLRGLDRAEQEALTYAMLHSGSVLELSAIAAPKGDKHSTGGVGDKTSLVIAPLAAACGLAVPMISGRGLGHTGGTLDKLEAIDGYNVNISPTEIERIVNVCGFAMAGQTDDIAPADRTIYALRDATATVPYIPLIVASIMSKKLAEGLDALVLDVKSGSGAFMPEYEDSLALARELVETGRKFKVRTEAVISDMSQPLGRFVGNAVETYECIRILRGETEAAASDTEALSIELTARLLNLAGLADGPEAARMIAADKLASGEAFERFRRNIELQGGDCRVCDDPDLLLPRGVEESSIKAPRGGFVSAIDTASMGNAIGAIGGGRTRAEDSVDHAVGYACTAKIGDHVAEGDYLGVLYSRGGDGAAQAADRLARCYTIGDEKPLPLPLIREIIS
jgi:pyrimidine-nucleoside phosphorylase